MTIFPCARRMTCWKPCFPLKKCKVLLQDISGNNVPDLDCWRTKSSSNYDNYLYVNPLDTLDRRGSRPRLGYCFSDGNGSCNSKRMQWIFSLTKLWALLSTSSLTGFTQFQAVDRRDPQDPRILYLWSVRINIPKIKYSVNIYLSFVHTFLYVIKKCMATWQSSSWNKQTLLTQSAGENTDCRMMLSIWKIIWSILTAHGWGVFAILY